MKPGLFITVEGADGAGKTTQLEILEQWLTEKGMEVVRTREPGGTELGEAVRDLLIGSADTPMDEQTELILMFCARMQHVVEVIRPSMDAGKCVLCDRFTDATYAYQGGGRGIDMERITILEEWVQQGLQPDLTIVFDLPEEAGVGRVSQRGEASDRFEKQNEEFKSAVRRVYLDRASRFPGRIRLVDASGSIDQVSENMFSIVGEVLDSRNTESGQGVKDS